MAHKSLDSTFAALHWLCNYPEEARVGDFFVAGELTDSDFGLAAQKILGDAQHLSDFVHCSVQSLVQSAEKQLGWN